MGEARSLRLRYTVRAATELDRILDFVAEQSPQGAQHVRARIRTVIDMLTDYPDAGRSTSRGLRRVVAHPYPYLIYYRATANEIVIHGVRHSARKPLSGRS
jgi:plasmid stabilization system protein ParE